jgi:hypothetical protein
MGKQTGGGGVIDDVLNQLGATVHTDPNVPNVFLHF